MSADRSGGVWQARLGDAGRRFGRIAVGDRVGVVVFLSALIWSIAFWRIGFFIQDSVTVANALANVAEGRLAIVDSPYALTLGSQPGLVTVDGTPYGRNYGHVLISLPVVWLLDGLALVTDLRLAVAAGWSVSVLLLGRQLGRLAGRDWLGTAGSAVALVAFLGNVLTVEPLPVDRTALMALQVTTMLAAALLATTLYRLVARFHGCKTGATAGIAVIVATPLGFWVSIPKRHVFTALVAVVVLYCFAVSRSDAGRGGRLTRAGAYATIGFLTTIHPFEAFFLFVVLVPLDLLTAPSNGVRSLGLVGAVFVLSLLPFVLINTAISGNPLQSPRLLSGAGSGLDIPTDTGSGTQTPTGTDGGGSSGGGSSGGGSSGDSGGDSGVPVLGFVAGVVGTAVGFTASVATFAWGWVTDGLAVLDDADRLYHIFVRSGDIPMVSPRINDYEAIELTLLESFPLAVAFVTLPALVLRRGRARIDRSVLSAPRRQTDLLAIAFAAVFTLVYLPTLPLVSQITLRYVLPVFPLLLYGVARLPVVHRSIDVVPQWLYGSYLLVVGVGGVAVAFTLAALDPALGEAMQFHALFGLAAAAVAAACLGSWPLHGQLRLVAVGLAVPAGATTVFLVFTGLEYFGYQLSGTPPGHEPFALDIVRLLAELLPIFPT